MHCVCMSVLYINTLIRHYASISLATQSQICPRGGPISFECPTPPLAVASMLFVVALAMTLAVAMAVTTEPRVVAENRLPGSPSEEWDVNGAGALDVVRGFAADILKTKTPPLVSDGQQHVKILMETKGPIH